MFYKAAACLQRRDLEVRLNNRTGVAMASPIGANQHAYVCSASTPVFHYSVLINITVTDSLQEHAFTFFYKYLHLCVRVCVCVYCIVHGRVRDTAFSC